MVSSGVSSGVVTSGVSTGVVTSGVSSGVVTSGVSMGVVTSGVSTGVVTSGVSLGVVSVGVSIGVVASVVASVEVKLSNIFSQAAVVSKSAAIKDTKTNLRIYALNDYNESKDIVVSYEIFDFTKGVVAKEEKSLTVDKIKNERVFDLSISDLKSKYNPKTTGVMAKLSCDGEVISRKTFLFDVEKNLEMPNTRLSLVREVKDNVIEVTVKADKFARIVCVASDLSLKPFTDNYFDLLPGESKTVTIPLEDGVDADKQIRAITAVSLSDIPTRKITAKEIFQQYKMMLSPYNIGNCIFHRAVPKDVSFD